MATAAKMRASEAVNGPHIPKWALIAAAIGATLSFGWLIYLTGQTDLPRWAKIAEALLFAWFVGRAWRQALQA
jgi:hypothetical protein